MECVHRNKLNDSNFCYVKCYYCTFQQKEECKMKHPEYFGMETWDKEEVWDAIHKLSEVRAGFSAFERQERSVYHACSLAIKALREVIGE